MGSAPEDIIWDTHKAHKRGLYIFLISATRKETEYKIEFARMELANLDHSLITHPSGITKQNLASAQRHINLLYTERFAQKEIYHKEAWFDKGDKNRKLLLAKG